MLSEYAQDWAKAVGRWRAASGAAGAGIAGGDEAQLYQTLLGAWPPGLAADDAAGLAAYGERVLGWWRKALREAKLATSWTAPDAGYEAACEAFLARLTGSAALYPLRAEIAAFAARIEAAGRANGLVQAFLKCVCPGAPDIYQGCEFADLSLVDPDNRRPVDYAARAAALERGARASPAAALAAGDYDGAKQGLIAGALAARRAHADAFAGADYAPLAASGPRAAHVLAFRRGPVVCAAAIRTARALEGRATPPADWWGETAIEVPGPWRDPLSGTEGWGTEGERGDGRGGAAPARELFAALPVALILPR
ncbi:hypothetical protein [Phenylobacterium sp.]|uniref:hypothetical protein n=1 Tax=Phenylobacterium sp. TaxID=1871053 RepID=UPI00391D7C4B